MSPAAYKDPVGIRPQSPHPALGEALARRARIGVRITGRDPTTLGNWRARFLLALRGKEGGTLLPRGALEREIFVEKGDPSPAPSIRADTRPSI
jgi:hypothetical protein